MKQTYDLLDSKGQPTESFQKMVQPYLIGGMTVVTQIMSDIFGKQRLITQFDTDARSHLFNIAYNKTNSSSAQIRVDPHEENRTATIYHLFPSKVFSGAAKTVGFPNIKTDRMGSVEDFISIIKILEQYEKKIRYYTKKYELTLEQAQEFATLLELFARRVGNSKWQETIWGTEQEYMKHVAALVKLNHSEANKYYFMDANTPLETIVATEGAIDEWIQALV